jgi:PAS domain-containing protein
MNEIQQATPRVKKNIFLIRLLLALTLYCFAFFFLQSHPDQKITVLAYALALAATFLPFYFLAEKVFEKVRFQYIVFSMDFVFLLAGLYLFDHFETNLLILTFLTFFISALSQSVGRSLFVAIAVVALYVDLVYFKSDNFNYMDPFLLLSCALLFVVSIHSAYLAFRTVQEEKEITDLVRRARLLSERVKEGDQMAMEYAATLKNVLDSLPIGAIAVSTDGSVFFVNAPVGKILDVNPKSLTNLYLFKENALGEIGSRMAQSLKDRKELKREYVDVVWNNKPRRLRLDSASGVSPSGRVWGILFLLQEAQRPAEENSALSPTPTDSK